MTCSICEELIEDYGYYTHFYIKGVNSDLKEIANLCPYRTNIFEAEGMHEREKYVTCEICSNEEIKEEMETLKERVGRTYKYILDLKTFEQM